MRYLFLLCSSKFGIVVDLRAVNQLLYFFFVEDVFKQLHHLGDLQFLDLRCNAFQGSCDGAKPVSTAFAVVVLVILLAVFQLGNFVGELFNLFLVFLFFSSELFKFRVRFVFHRTSFVCCCFQPCGYGMI